MSRDHEVLSRCCSEHFPARLRPLIQNLLEFVLACQYATDPVSNAFYRVRCGSGMWMKHSGSVSDLSLATLLEVGLIDRPEQLSEVGIQGYVRYRDDVRVAITSMSRFWNMKRILKSRCEPTYMLEFEEYSYGYVSFLDLEVYKYTVDGCTRLGWRPYTKPSNRAVPLASHSFHNPCIHMSWPLNEMHRLHQHSCTVFDFQSARQKKT